MSRLVARGGAALTGEVRVPGDKSISHRALLIASMAVGETSVRGLLEGADVIATANALRALGVELGRGDDGVWRVDGVGVGGLAEPGQILDMGNSGTGARLLAGLLASHPFTSFMTGDASLVSRPMDRITIPLESMGATFLTRSGGRLPMAVTGSREPIPITYRPQVASAQVKSAVLLAALEAPGATTVIERATTRDHTEIMLRHFGAGIAVEDAEGGARAVIVTGQAELSAREVEVPADISSAAFPLVAALICPGSQVTLPGVGVNPLRAGLLETLEEMGADVTLAGARTAAGEPVADLTARAGPLTGVEVPPERAPRMIDEYPVLAAAAACAEGETVLRGLAELRVKESDRVAAITDGLVACGVRVEGEGDELVIHGTGAPPEGGATIAARLDHRIAMAFLVLGLAARAPVRIDDARPIETSFPGFAALMTGLGADIANDEEAA